MKTYVTLLVVLVCISCNSSKIKTERSNVDTDFTIAFGSCNKAELTNKLWDDILLASPNVWIWGGDNIYADTDDIEKLSAMYLAQDNVPNYKALKNKVAIIGTWDDHDYGLNDGGIEFSAKDESQQAFLDFMDVPIDSPRREQKGVYNAHEFITAEGTIKVLVLDTRYFRTAVTADTITAKRLKPNNYGEGTILGEQQWTWLEAELQNSKADYNILVSSIQILSNEHGFEGWGNFPHEVDRLKNILLRSKAKRVIILSGDRHISEFSKTNINGLSYPLIDFTSSGLTHAYNGYKGETNPFRVGEVVFTESFGLLQFNFKSHVVQLKIIGDGGQVLQNLEQRYE